MPVNGHHLKLYHKPTSREELCEELQAKIEQFIIEDITFMMESNNA